MASKPLEDVELEKQQLELQKEQMKELKNIASKNSVQQIKEAKDLLDSGGITEDEFKISPAANRRLFDMIAAGRFDFDQLIGEKGGIDAPLGFTSHTPRQKPTTNPA